jgi:hypothetical protein
MAGISVHSRTRKFVLLRTLDVRQVRRWALGKRKASRMKSNLSILPNQQEIAIP